MENLPEKGQTPNGKKAEWVKLPEAELGEDPGMSRINRLAWDENLTPTKVLIGFGMFWAHVDRGRS